MTLLTIAVQSLMLSLIPVQRELLLQDPLVAVIVGSVLCAIGTVMIFNGKGSGGGIDVIGIYLSQSNKGSVGSIYMLVNTSVYLLCLLFYDFQTAVYSMIHSTLLSFAVDRIHKRNIEVELMILQRTVLFCVSVCLLTVSAESPAGTALVHIQRPRRKSFSVS